MSHLSSLFTASLFINSLSLIILILGQNDLKKSLGQRSVPMQRKGSLEILTRFCLAFQLAGALAQAKG